MSDYKEKLKIARAVEEVFSSDAGVGVLEWLKGYVGYGAPAFMNGEVYDDRAAAHRDGAKMVVWAIMTMVELAHKTEEVDCD